MFKHIKSNYSQEEFRKFINHKGHNGMSALHHAGVHGHSPVLNVLLRNYADVTSVDNRNRTIFHAVSYSGCIVCFDYVTDYLKKAVEVQQKKEKKMTKKTKNTKNTKQNTAEIVEYSDSSSSSEDEGLELAQETKVLNWINMTDTNSISPVHMAAWTASKRALQWGYSAEFLQKMCRFFTEKLHFFYRKRTFSVKKNYRKRTFSVKNL